MIVAVKPTPQNLFDANGGLVGFCLRDVISTPLPSSDYEDLKQVGRLALWDACLGYNDHSFQFSTYAVPIIRRALVKSLAKEGRYRARHAELVLRLTRHYERSQVEVPQYRNGLDKIVVVRERADGADELMRDTDLQAAIKNLPKKMRYVLVRRFGLFGYTAMSANDLAEQMDSTQAAVWQIQSRACKRLKKAMRETGE